MSDTCPCGSTKSFARCCSPFLRGDERPATPEQLMRSRFTAYVLRDAAYLLKTWFPATAPRVAVAELLTDSPYWQALEVIASSQQGGKGSVEFRAWYTEPGAPLQRHVMHEVSEFVRLQGRWLYVGGRVS